MSSNKLDYKIEKYIHKLKNAETLDDAETYQRKLRQYHRINQFDMPKISSKRSMIGGDNQLETVQDLISQLSEMSGGGINNIDKLEGKVDEIRSLLGEMKEVNKNSEVINKTESELGLNNLAIDLGNITDGSDLDPEGLELDIGQLVANL